MPPQSPNDDFPLIDDLDIEYLFDPVVMERGVGIVDDDLVFDVTWDFEDGIIDGLVIGTAPRPYRTKVRLERNAGEPGWWHPVESKCTCPVGDECKHGAALCLFIDGVARGVSSDDDPGEDSEIEALYEKVQNNKDALDKLLDELSGAGVGRASELDSSDSWASPANTGWRNVLSGLIPDMPREEETTELALGVELYALEFGSSSSPWAFRYTSQWRPATLQDIAQEAPLSVRLRPLRRGKRNNWIKTGVSWPQFAFAQPTGGKGVRFKPAQGQAMHLLNQLYTTAVSDLAAKDMINLSMINMPYLWEVLDNVTQAGIPLVGQGLVSHVDITSPARVLFDTTTRDDGAVLLDAKVRFDGQTLKPQAAIGSAGLLHLVSDPANPKKVAIQLIPVDEPLDPTVMELLEATDPVIIPEHEVEDFIEEFYPRISGVAPVTSTDASVDLPDIPPPSLEITVDFGQEILRNQRVDTLRITTSWHNVGPQDHDEHRQHVLATAREVWPELRVPQRTKLVGPDAARFSQHVMPELAELDYVTVHEAEEIPEYQELTGDPAVTLNAVESTQNDWFDLGFQVTIDGRTVPFTDIFTALATGQDAVLLSDKTYFSLDHPAFDQLRTLIEQASAIEDFSPETPAISRYSTDLIEAAKALADEVFVDPALDAWLSTVASLRELEDIPAVDVPDTVQADLRDYQVEGFRWLAYLYDHDLGGILADDMGLGKTLQALALIDYACSKESSSSPFLVIAPSSVLSVWKEEVERFVPHLKATVLDTSSLRRSTPLEDVVAESDIVITSYAIARIDDTNFAAHRWAGVILDEAQFVKNPATKAHKAIGSIPTDFLLAITGTPMENSLNDLWSIFNLSVPGLFPNFRSFRNNYLKPIEAAQRIAREDSAGDDAPISAEQAEDREKTRTRGEATLDRLRNRIRPFMLRRTKEKVAAELPEKQEQVVRVRMEPEHQKLYDQILQRERKKVLRLVSDMDANRFSVFSSLSLLRMLALDPAIVHEDYADIPGSKLNDLLGRLDEVLADQHRVIIFSQYTRFLDRVRTALDEREIDYAYLDGATANRAKVIERFRADEVPVFLISLKAGGFGLTLTEADYVFLMDPWWNPAVEAQAIDRAHRIGQDKNVMVYRMVSAGTIEEKVLELQRQKAELFDALTDGEAAFSGSITADDIRALFDSDTSEDEASQE